MSSNDPMPTLKKKLIFGTIFGYSICAAFFLMSLNPIFNILFPVAPNNTIPLDKFYELQSTLRTTSYLTTGLFSLFLIPNAIKIRRTLIDAKKIGTWNAKEEVKKWMEKKDVDVK